jgi:Ser/Thr protein kinase RdoA (MazF antagonist)
MADNLIILYQKLMNLPDAKFTLITHDDALVAVVYHITLSDNTKLILKICTNKSQHYFREIYCLTHFANQLPVPKIIQQISPSADIYGAILMECLPGSLLKIAEFTDQLAYELGALLAQIHLNRVSGYGDLIDQANLTSDPRIEFERIFNDSLIECAGYLPNTLLAQCRAYHTKNLDLLLSVDGPCITHRDFRPGNILIINNRVSGIIDWSSARAGFAEEDFCLLEDLWTTDPQSKAAFLAGYSSIRTVPEYSKIMPLLRLNKAMVTIGFTIKRNLWKSSGAPVYQFYRKFLEELLKAHPI